MNSNPLHVLNHSLPLHISSSFFFSFSFSCYSYSSILSYSSCYTYIRLEIHRFAEYMPRLPAKHNRRKIIMYNTRDFLGHKFLSNCHKFRIYFIGKYNIRRRNPLTVIYWSAFEFRRCSIVCATTALTGFVFNFPKTN